MATNMIVLQGNVVADPTFHGEGETVARFTIGNNTGFGEHAESHFVDCVAFGKQVETIKKYITKGKEIVITGKLVQSTWETPEGQKRSKLEVRLNTFEGFSFTNGGGSRADEPVAAVSNGEKKQLY
jgi:single-strand DNA-binding protein